MHALVIGYYGDITIGVLAENASLVCEGEGIEAAPRETAKFSRRSGAS